MTDEAELEREAAICESCGIATAVRVGPDGDVRPIGSTEGKCCEDSSFRIMDEEPDDGEAE